jgi:transposase
MIPEKAFERLLGLDDGWEVRSAEFETTPAERFLLHIYETDKLWAKQVCPKETCGGRGITCYDHVPERVWRHLDAFGKRTELVCALPRGQCPDCQQVFRIKPPWEGEGKHFTRDFEAFTLTLAREMPVKKVGEIVQEDDTKLWRMIFGHVGKAYAALDLSNLVHLGADEASCRKGHDYLTLFVDLIEKRVVFATEGKDADTFQRFAEEMLKHNGHPKSITRVAVDMSPAYTRGVRENLGNAEIVYDKFHVTALANTAVDEVRRKEARSGDSETQAQLKKTRYVFLKNPENLTENEAARLEELDLKHLATGQAYAMRMELQDIYRCRTIEKARERFGYWIAWVGHRAEAIGALLAPMHRVAKTIEKHLEGILAHWQEGLTTAFLEGLNSVFSAVKRKARGYRSSTYMITMLYMVAGKLTLPSLVTH